MDRQETYVGIDVAKAGMDVAARPSDERWAISNDETGIRQLVSRLKTLEPCHRGTGGVRRLGTAPCGGTGG